MPHLVAATDLSERGDRAVHRAIMLAKSSAAKLTVITAVDDALPAGIGERIAIDSKAELDRLVASFPETKAMTVETRVVRGDPAHAVAGFSTSEAADLLIAGTHRERAFADLFHQTTLQRIVSLLRCPVLVVKTPPATPYSSVLEAVDFSPASAAAVTRALRFAPDARHVGVHVYHVPYRGFAPHDGAPAFRHEAEHAEAAWRKRFSIDTADLRIHLVEGGVRSELIQRISENGHDLLALGAHGRSGISAAVLGSIATALMREPPCDLLIVRPDADAV